MSLRLMLQAIDRVDVLVTLFLGHLLKSFSGDELLLEVLLCVIHHAALSMLLVGTYLAS